MLSHIINRTYLFSFNSAAVAMDVCYRGKGPDSQVVPPASVMLPPQAQSAPRVTQTRQQAQLTTAQPQQNAITAAVLAAVNGQLGESFIAAFLLMDIFSTPGYNPLQVSDYSGQMAALQQYAISQQQLQTGNPGMIIMIN